MRATTCGALMALSVMAATAAEPDLENANYILPGCKNLIAPDLSATHDLTLKTGICLGTVSSVASMAQRLHRDVWCIPGRVTNAELVMVVVRYIEARPQEMHRPFEALTMLALMDAWPCKK